MTTTTELHAAPPMLDTTFLIRAKPDRIWEALVNPAQLQMWFAERVDVEPRVGGAFRFWGKYTPTFGVAGEPDQRFEAFEPGRRMVFTWTWAGALTRCELSLQPKGELETKLHIRHQVLGRMVPFDSTECGWFAKDFWELSAGNLDNYLRKGKAAVRPDHTIKGRDVELSIEIDAPAAKVWEAITVPEKIAKWLGENPEFPSQVSVDLRVGGAYSFGWKKDGESIGPAAVLELEPGKRLLYTWHYPGDTTGKTEWKVEPLDRNRSLLTVRQIGVSTDRERSGYSNGWASFMVAIGRTTE